MDGTIFGKILAGEAEVSWIAGERSVAAFMDLHPVNPGHTLVIPERPAVGLADLDPEDGRQMFVMAQKVAAAIRASDIPCDGVNPRAGPRRTLDERATEISTQRRGGCSYKTAKPFSRSARMSSMCSMPTLRRTRPG